MGIFSIGLQNKIFNFSILWIFVSHCWSKDLFASFGEVVHWEPDLLLQIGINSLNVILKIEQDLSSQIMNGYGVSFLNIGTCSLHETRSHNVFWRSVCDFGFDIETFAFVKYYLFKSSALHRKCYEMMQFFTDIETKYVIKTCYLISCHQKTTSNNIREMGQPF